MDSWQYVFVMCMYLDQQILLRDTFFKDYHLGLRHDTYVDTLIKLKNNQEMVK